MSWYKKAQVSELNQIVQKWKSAVPGLILSVSENEKKIYLLVLIVPKGMRKRGLGSQIVQELVNYADRVGKRIELTTGIRDPSVGTTSKGRLVRFYKRFGFRENKGRGKDFTTSENMLREPER